MTASSLFSALSKRAQAILSDPRHLLLEKRGARKNYWHFSIEKIQQNHFQKDKILTLSYFASGGELGDGNGAEDLFHALFQEAISRIGHGKAVLYLLQLSFRELENFLRDENHLPFFDHSAIDLAENIFKMVKNTLLVDLVLKEIENKDSFSPSQKGWEQLNLVEKNRKALLFVEVLNNLFFPVTNLQLALVEEYEMAILMNDFPVGVEVIKALVIELFGNVEEISSFKVVAVQ